MKLDSKLGGGCFGMAILTRDEIHESFGMEWKIGHRSPTRFVSTTRDVAD